MGPFLFTSNFLKEETLQEEILKGAYNKLLEKVRFFMLYSVKIGKMSKPETLCDVI